MKQLKIPAAFMRGGTSKAVVFNAKDLPRDRAQWDEVFLAAIGSPDPYGRQLDGMGGGVSSLSKVCVVGPSTRSDADIDYTFFLGANLTLRFIEKTPGGADWLQLVQTDDPTTPADESATIYDEYLIGNDTVLAVNIRPTDVLGLDVGGQFEDTLTVDLGFNGTPDSATRPSLHITFNGADEFLPADLTSANDLLILVSTDGAGAADLTPFTLDSLAINSTEEVNINGTRADVAINGKIDVEREMSVDVRATDSAAYSALIDLVHASSMATIDVLGGAINAGTLYLTAVSTQVIDVGGFELGGFQFGILNSISDARVSVGGNTEITTTKGGITLGATSAVLAHNVLAPNPGNDADTDAAVASTTIFPDAFAKVSGDAKLDSAAAIYLTAGNSVDAKAHADASKGGAGAVLGFSLVLAEAEASINGNATVGDFNGDSKQATSINLTANSDHDLDVMAKAAPGGATNAKAQDVTIDNGRINQERLSFSTARGPLGNSIKYSYEGKIYKGIIALEIRGPDITQSILHAILRRIPQRSGPKPLRGEPGAGERR